MMVPMAVADVYLLTRTFFTGSFGAFDICSLPKLQIQKPIQHFYNEDLFDSLAQMGNK